jgi:predicted CopG family antitoxin
MATKTISLRLEAYDKLKAARRYPAESFSEVVLRATWADTTTTAAEFLSMCRERGPLFTMEELDRVEAMKKKDTPPEDKWKRR